MEDNKNTPQNSMEEQIKRKKRIKLITSVVVSIVVFVVIVVTYLLICYYNGPERKRRERVGEFLQEEYDDEFKLKFIKKRYASTYEDFGCDGSSLLVRTGYDTDVIEYVYSFTSKNSDSGITSYAVYAYNKEEETYEIYETSTAKASQCGYGGGSSYGEKTENYNQYLEIEDSLKSCLGEDYTVDLYKGNSQRINIQTKKYLEEELINNYSEFSDLYNNIVEVLSDVDLAVYIYYKDAEVYIDKDCELEENDTVIAMNQYLEIRDSLENCLGEGYTIDSFKIKTLTSGHTAIYIETKKSLEKEVLKNYSEFRDLYNNIRELVYDKDIYVYIDYIDADVRIDTYSEIEKDKAIKTILEYRKGRDSL